MFEPDALLGRIAALQDHGPVPAWDDVRARATQLRAGRRRRRRVACALVLAGAAILAVPSVGLGERLVDVLADRDARPALQQYLASLPGGHGIGKLDSAQARELIDADSARGKITLFEAPSTSGSRCIGFYADWLSDPGVACGYTSAEPTSLSESLMARLDPHVLAISGVAPTTATSVQLDADGNTSTSPVVDGFFFFTLDPATLNSTPTATLTAFAAGGQSIAARPLDLAHFLQPVCTQHLPNRIVTSLTVGSVAVEIHEARTPIERCWWVESDGEIEGGIYSAPIPGSAVDPNVGPAILLRTATFASGIAVLWGEAQIDAQRATITLADGTTEDEPVAERYLLGPLAPASTPGKRPVKIDLYSADGVRLSSQAVDPENPEKLLP